MVIPSRIEGGLSEPRAFSQFATPPKHGLGSNSSKMKFSATVFCHWGKFPTKIESIPGQPSPHARGSLSGFAATFWSGKAQAWQTTLLLHAFPKSFSYACSNGHATYQYHYTYRAQGPYCLQKDEKDDFLAFPWTFSRYKWLAYTFLHNIIKLTVHACPTHWHGAQLYNIQRSLYTVLKFKPIKLVKLYICTVWYSAWS